MSGFSRVEEAQKTAWAHRPDWRLDAATADHYAKRLEASGRFRCQVFPLAEGVALLHAEPRSVAPFPERFAFRTAAECAELAASVGGEAQRPSSAQLPLEGL